ncbi:MAG TPA: DUF5686 family protein [Mucilaginibacter sp.]|nr:DUF5686 family protein [Mucilaginibacter sp.]
MRFLLSITLLILLSVAARGQYSVVSGTIKDAQTNQALPFVTVSFPGTSIGVTSDNNGKYRITTDKTYTQLKFSFMGYNTVIRTIVAGKEQVINVKMQSGAHALAAVTIKAGKNKRYRNKNNPAVELIRQVIAHKDENRMQSYDYIEYKQYEKLQFSFINVSEKFFKGALTHNYKFLYDDRDTTDLPGKSLLPVYQEEKSTQTYYRKNPQKTKKIVMGEKKANVVNFVDEEGVNSYLNRMYNEVDVYQNNIFLMTNEFLSPICDAAPTFYKFFITDTIEVDHQKLVELSFTPRNGNDMLFEGLIFVSLDGKYSVQKARLSINKNINLNWVKGMSIDLDYEQNPDGRYHLAKSTMKASFAVKKSGDKGIFGERTISYTNYLINVPRPDSVYAGNEVTVRPDAMNRNEAFWVNSRGHDTLTAIEAGAYRNIDSLQTIPSFRHLMGTINLLAVGFAEAGPVEIGPIGTFYSYNPVEGSRAKFALRTTDTFSTRYYLAGYGAYGFRDQRFKYLLSATYSLNNKSIYKFPNDYIKLSTQYEVKIPGEELAFLQTDQFYTSFTRGVNNKFLYNRYYKADYFHEFENHFSYSFEFKNWQQTPAGSLYFANTLNGVPNTVPSITTSELAVGLRYAPHEQIFQGKLYRIDIPNKYPVLMLNYQQNIKGLFGGQYSYQNLYGRVDKRFYLSQLGYADVTVEGSYLFGQVPFPLLEIQHANQTYAFDLHSYNLMNFMEFVSDHYADVKLDYDLNGFIFNKIPLIKKLKWREIVSFKVLYGGLRSENDPALHPSLLQFPTDQAGTPITYTLGKQPYMEGGIGIGNIFKIFRIDLVERFNYLNNPNVSRLGIRGSAWFDF